MSRTPAQRHCWRAGRRWRSGERSAASWACLSSSLSSRRARSAASCCAANRWGRPHTLPAKARQHRLPASHGGNDGPAQGGACPPFHGRGFLERDVELAGPEAGRPLPQRHATVPQPRALERPDLAALGRRVEPARRSSMPTLSSHGSRRRGRAGSRPCRPSIVQS